MQQVDNILFIEKQSAEVFYTTFVAYFLPIYFILTFGSLKNDFLCLTPLL